MAWKTCRPPCAPAATWNNRPRASSCWSTASVSETVDSQGGRLAGALFYFLARYCRQLASLLLELAPQLGGIGKFAAALRVQGIRVITPDAALTKRRRWLRGSAVEGVVHAVHLRWRPH